MNSIFEHHLWRNTVEDWLISLSILVFTIVFARLIYKIVNFSLRKLTSRTENKIVDIVVEQLRNPAIFAIILVGLWFALDRLHFTPGIEKTIRKGFVLLTAFVITWLFVRVINAIIREFLLPYSQRADNNLDAQLISLIQQVVKITIWSFGIIVGLNNAGFNVGALIAGLGIGGLALALASQDTVKNMFGGVILYLDKPFQVGDRVVIDRFDGIISEIGIRSTRMRTLEGLIVTIPNAHFSEKPIENYSQGPFFRVSCLINLDYNTAPQKVKEALEILRQIADENKEYFASNPLIFVEQFGVFAIEVKFLYYLKQEVNVVEFRNNVNMAILQRFHQAGISFAQPSQRN